MDKLKLFLDTNIVIDYLHHRDPFYEKARLLMIGARVGEFELWISSSQVTDIIFIMTHGGDEKRVAEALERLRGLRYFVNVCSVTDRDIDKMLATTWLDPEDDLIANLAYKTQACAIITRDKDFPRPEGIRVMDCDGFFDWVAEEFNVTYAEVPL